MGTAERVRVVVGVGDGADAVAVLQAAAAYARSVDAELVAVRAWLPPGGEFNCHLRPDSPVLQACREQPGQVLAAAFTKGFGGRPAGLPVSFAVGRGEVGPVLVGTADRPGDVLVVSGARRRSLAVWCRGSVSRYCLDHATCQVLVFDEQDHHRPGHLAPGREMPTGHRRSIAV